ncbi:MAG: GNAT family N-acetyltransferase [Bacteroidota bacterium]
MITDLSVRRADATDLDALVPLFDGYRMFYRQASDPEAARAFMTDRLGGEDAVVFLAHLGDAPVGFTQLYPLFSSVRMRRVWLLNDLYVALEARRQGVAEALMNAARDFARDDGAVAVQLATEHDNTGAQALYERLGYARDTDFRTYELTL